MDVPGVSFVEVIDLLEDFLRKGPPLRLEEGGGKVEVCIYIDGSDGYLGHALVERTLGGEEHLAPHVRLAPREDEMDIVQILEV